MKMKPFTAIALLMLVSMAMARWTPLGEKFNRLYEYDYADEDEDSGYAGGLLQKGDENAYADKNEEPGYADELYEDEDAYADREDQKEDPEVPSVECTTLYGQTEYCYFPQTCVYVTADNGQTFGQCQNAQG